MMQSTANLCKMELIISLYNFNVQNNATSWLAGRLAKTESLYHLRAALYAYITMRETERNRESRHFMLCTGACNVQNVQKLTHPQRVEKTRCTF